jgi:iron complex transport system substrate-binding protein
MISSVLSELFFVGLAGVMFVLALLHPRLQKPNINMVLPAKRVVMLDNSLASYLTINNGINHILAISGFASKWVGEGMLDRIYPEVKQIPHADELGVPDPELLLYLHADVVFTWSNRAQMAKEIGLPGVIELWVDSNDPIGSRQRFWRLMGQVSGQDARAIAILDKWAAKRAALRESVPQNPAQQVKVAWIHVDRGDWYMTNMQFWNAYKLDSAGAQNAGKGFETMGVYDMEELLQADPDVILFEFQEPNHDAPTALNDILSRPGFQSLRAVRDRRIYKVPQHNITNEPFEDLLVLTWMAEVFYPNVMPHRLREEYKQDYWDVYHYAISDDEIDKAIYLDDNRQSAGYKRFERSSAPQ